MTIKTMIFGRRRLGQTLAEHRSHMKDIHGQMVLDYIRLHPDQAPRRYVQNHAFDGIYPGSDARLGLFSLGLDFVTEVWFPDLAAAKASRETPFYIEHLQPDEPLMVDDSTVLALPVTEEVIREPAKGETDGFKAFVVWHGAPPPADAGEALQPIYAAALGHCRNRPIFPAQVHAIDVFFFADEAAALQFSQSLRDALVGEMPSGGTDMTVTLARQHVVFAG
jgi:hypothetical protein